MIDRSNPQLARKLEQMNEINNKSIAREAAENWRHHVPVYGWMKVNFPTSIQCPLREKYQEEKNRRKEEADLIEKQKEEEIERLKREAALNSLNAGSKKNQQIQSQKDKKVNRPNPETINENEMKDLEKLIPKDYSENFLKNYENNDFGFLKKQCKKFELNKKGYDMETEIPHNYSKIMIEGENKFLYQLGIKNASTYLTTMPYEQKAKYIDENMIFDKKYCTMYPKSAILGPKLDDNFENKSNRNNGNVSFEENTEEFEAVKNLRRLPPENVTEEWVKENLTDYVTKINFENCYWLTKDLISKLGRLDNSLKECSIRNLDISNYIVENILANAKGICNFNISCCTGLTNGVLEIIGEKGKNIEILNISNIPNSINDNGLIYLGSHLPKLKSLNISQNKAITDIGIKGLICATLPLETLNISHNYKLTDESLSLIFHYLFQTLKDISINCLPLITDKGLSELSKCQSLINFEVIGTNVNSVITDSIAKLDNFEIIDISGNKKVKDEDIKLLINRNKKLKILRASNCTLLTNGLLDYFTKEDTSHLLLLEINRTPLISDQKITECMEKMKPNLRIIRATNLVWNKKDYGLTVPYQRDTYEKPSIKGVKKAAVKGGDDKSPEAQLIKLREEMKPKTIGEYFNPDDGAKKGKKKK